MVLNELRLGVIMYEYAPKKELLGCLIRFISHSVISGFTTSSTMIIGLSQAKYFLGYNIVNSSKIIPLVKSIVAGADKLLTPCVAVIHSRKIKEAAKIFKSWRSPHCGSSGNYLCENISSIINFFGEKLKDVTNFWPCNALVIFILKHLSLLFSAYPTTGSFQGQLSTMKVVPNLEYLGLFLCGLAAIVISAVIGLVRIPPF
ncbi:hypothetical protein PIB30_075993 [Stylosanthes scabra]|uniref:SLC26A/SulP transporter domain-containing protein n=1 Tax=Stylosanthes scabra TaxID=79078 RepID=A0ABU6SRF3_9FABA|nr:hypothetical protein [Stylosanthes scabra]